MDTHDTTLFDVMQKQFNDTYNKQFEQKLIKSVGKIIEGNYYAAWKIDSGWHRVRALEVHQTDAKCLCLFVDIGEDCLINFGDIYALHMDFARVRAQAFACKLTGLDALFDVSQDSQAIRDLQGMDVTLEAVGGDDEEDVQKIFSVVMYDLETGQACNKDLMISIAVENATHHFETDKTYEVFVSHIGIKSMFYVQIRSVGYDSMLNLIKDLQGDLPQQQITITRENSIGKLYFAKLEDGCHRVRIIDSSPNFEYAQLLYVDVGTTKVVPINNTQLIPLETLSPALNRFPPQATLVSLHSESKLIVDDFVDKIKELLPQEQSVLMRVQDIHEDVPSVMLLYRIRMD
ncbi:uncharacterized protein [Atheta coriaria]|uniref:uncharacterized protein n=1 Tax=Dalotia coriaria TaxID=877792 RepID=UPI0031F39B6E